MKQKLGKYMTAELMYKSDNPHGRWWEIANAKHGNMLGRVDWYGSAWRQYIFEGMTGAVFSHDCLIDIAKFLKQKTEEAKK